MHSFGGDGEYLFFGHQNEEGKYDALYINFK